jgi:alpha-beta hydrolase superfamily lysophospholipase
MGGAIAMRVAADVQADGLIMLAPFWRLPLSPVLRWLSPALRLVIRQVKPFRAVDLNQGQVQAGIKEFMPDLSLENAEVLQEIRNLSVPTGLFVQLDDLGRRALRAASDFSRPTLIIQGTHDELVHPSSTRKLAMRLGGPVEYLELPAHHDLVDETQDAWQHVTARAVAFATQMTEMFPKG